MKKLLLILLCLPLIGLGQQMTYVPDDNFEAYLEANGMGNGIPNDDSVLTAKIDTVATLSPSFQGIYDFTGIEDFIALKHLGMGGGNGTSSQVMTLDLSNNLLLEELSFDVAYITSLDISANTALTRLFMHAVQGFNYLDVSNNTALTDLHIGAQCCMTSLDLSNNTALHHLNLNNTTLTTLDLRNGNNQNISIINTPSPLSTFRPWFGSNWFLTCINVDDANWSTANWIHIDSQHYFSNNCPPPSTIQEQITNKELLRTIDVLGRETKETNQPLFYIYDDGTVEKRIIVE